MTFDVTIQRRAEADIDEAYLDLLHRRSEADADRWLAEVYRLLATLKQMPERCGLAYEAHIVQEPLRQLLIGKDQSCFRTLFIVRRQRVFVLRLRHAARRPVQRAQLGLNEVEENADG